MERVNEAPFSRFLQCTVKHLVSVSPSLHFQFPNLSPQNFSLSVVVTKAQRNHMDAATKTGSKTVHHRQAISDTQAPSKRRSPLHSATPADLLNSLLWIWFRVWKNKSSSNKTWRNNGTWRVLQFAQYATLSPHSKRAVGLVPEWI